MSHKLVYFALLYIIGIMLVNLRYGFVKVPLHPLTDGSNKGNC